jgi:hypothetical protein
MSSEIKKKTYDVFMISFTVIIQDILIISYDDVKRPMISS